MKLHLCVWITLIGVGISGCSAFTPKPMARVFEVRQEWVKQTLNHDNMGFRKINRMKPLLYKNNLIQANALDGIAAFDKDTGNVKWRFLVQNGAESGAMLSGEKIYFGASDGYFYCLDANNGQTIWSFPTRSENLSEPLIQDGVVYFLSGNETFYALDAATGKQLWIYSRQDLSSFLIRGGSRPTISENRIYVGFSDGYLVALDYHAGTLVWEKQLNKNKKFRDIDSNPVVIDGHLYITGYDDHIYSLSPSSGHIEWKVDGGGYGGILVQGDNLYLATTDSQFLCLEKGSGKVKWSYKLKGGLATSAISYKGMIIFGESQGDLKFIDALSGKVVSSYTPGQGILSEPTSDDSSKMIYFISGEANLYALRADWVIPNHIKYLR